MLQDTSMFIQSSRPLHIQKLYVTIRP